MNTQIETLKQQLRLLEARIKEYMATIDYGLIWPFGPGRKEMEQVRQMMRERKHCLDQLFALQATPAEVERFARINTMLNEATHHTYASSGNLYRALLRLEPDTQFDDDYEVQSRLILSCMGEEEVTLQMEEDANYPSDFSYMLDVLSRLEEIGLSCGEEIVHSHISYQGNSHSPEVTDEELGVEVPFDDDLSWAEEGLRCDKLNHIKVCYAVHAICCHKHYSIADLLRVNLYEQTDELLCQHFIYTTPPSGEVADEDKIDKEDKGNDDNDEPERFEIPAEVSPCDLEIDFSSTDAEDLHNQIWDIEDTDRLRSILQAFEREIKRIVGSDPFSLCENQLSEEEKMRVDDYLGTRGFLLNRMFHFHATPGEVKRFEHVNRLLLDAEHQLRLRTANLYRQMLRSRYLEELNQARLWMVESRLHPVYSDRSSILRLPEDDFYGSDFRYMLILQICINSRSYTSNLCDRIYYDPDDTPNRNDEQLCGDKCMSDQCADWKEAHLRTPQLEHINVCYAIHDLCTHRPHYAIPDLLRLNEYWAECLVDRETEWVP